MAGSYKGEPMTGKVTEDNFHTTKLKLLAEKISTTLEKRFTDVSEDVVAATRIANFRQWPLFSMKEDVTGKVSYLHTKVLKSYNQKYTAIILSRDVLCIYNSVWRKRTPSPMSMVC